MSDLAQYGGSLGIIIIAVVLLIKTFLPWLNKPSEEHNNRDWTIQRDIEKTLGEIKSSMILQANAQSRMADSLAVMAEDLTSVKNGMHNLPKDIAQAIKYRGNGYG